MSKEAIRYRFGVTLIEIVIVVAIASIVIGMAMLVMNRTTLQFKKGTDMVNIQRLMDLIVERIRTDVRALKRIEKSECGDNKFTFWAISDGEEKKISYIYDAIKQTLFRTSKDGSSNVKSDFHGAKQVKSFIFKIEPEDGDFEFLKVVMQLVSDEHGSGGESTLSIACNFFSVCAENGLTIGKLRELNKK